MLDAQPLAAIGIGPTGNIAGGEHIRRTGLQVIVDEYAMVNRQTGFLGEIETRPHADAD